MRLFLWLLLLLYVVESKGQSEVFCHAGPKHNLRFSNNIYDAGLGDNYYFWETGKIIYIRFLNGSNEMQAAIKQIAIEWTKHANLEFEFRNEELAQIRIDLNDRLFNSSVGVMANVYPMEEANVFIDTSRFSDRKFMKGMVLHMFGHLLGLEHENIVPANGRKWNIDRIKNTPFIKEWDEDRIQRDLIAPYSVSRTNHIIADKRSIMYQFFPSGWTNEKYQPMNGELSLQDIALIKKIYPFNTSGQPASQFFSVGNYKSTSVEMNQFGFCFFPQFELTLKEEGGLYFSILLFDEEGNPIINYDADYVLDEQVATTKAFNILQKGKINFNGSKSGLGLFLPFGQVPYQYKGKKLMARFKVFVPNIYKEGEIKDFDSPPFYISVP